MKKTETIKLLNSAVSDLRTAFATAGAGDRPKLRRAFKELKAAIVFVSAEDEEAEESEDDEASEEAETPAEEAAESPAEQAEEMAEGEEAPMAEDMGDEGMADDMGQDMYGDDDEDADDIAEEEDDYQDAVQLLNILLQEEGLNPEEMDLEPECTDCADLDPCAECAEKMELHTEEVEDAMDVAEELAEGAAEDMDVEDMGVSADRDADLAVASLALAAAALSAADDDVDTDVKDSADDKADEPEADDQDVDTDVNPDDDLADMADLDEESEDQTDDPDMSDSDDVMPDSTADEFDDMLEDDGLAEEPELDEEGNPIEEPEAELDEDGNPISPEEDDILEEDADEALSPEQLAQLESEGIIESVAARMARIGAAAKALKASQSEPSRPRVLPSRAKPTAASDEAEDTDDLNWPLPAKKPLGVPKPEAKKPEAEAATDPDDQEALDLDGPQTQATFVAFLSSMSPRDRAEYLHLNDGGMGQTLSAKRVSQAMQQAKTSRGAKVRKARKFRSKVQQSRKGKVAAVRTPGGKIKKARKRFFFSTYDAQGKFLGTTWMAKRSPSRDAVKAYKEKHGVAHPATLPQRNKEQLDKMRARAPEAAKAASVPTRKPMGSVTKPRARATKPLRTSK